MQTGVQLGQNLLRRHGDDRAWPEDGRCPVFAQELVIRSRDDAADDAHDVRTAQLGQLFNQSREQRLVVSSTTVKTHVGNVLTKLNVRDRVQAVVVAYETGLMA